MEEKNEQPIRVLIIEDDENTADSMCLILEEFGFSVNGVANNLETALGFLNKNQFDIALIDIQLNGSNSGIEIGKLIHNLYRLPFIFITGFTDRSIIADAVKAQPAAYLIKPPNPASLFGCIQTAIQNYSIQQVGVINHVQENDFFFIKSRGKLKKILWSQVVLLSSADNYTAIQLEDSSEYYLRTSLSMMLKFQIPNNLKKHFIQINRGEAVQIKFIKEIHEEEIITSTKRLTLTKSYSREVKERLNILS